MRNRALHDALHDFTLEAAALLSADLDAGATLDFDLAEAGGRGAILYRYSPRTAPFVAERWRRLRTLPSFMPAAAALGSGSRAYLRVRGAPGADAEPALRALLERLYEDASDFGFPEERFERVYGEVESVLSSAGARTAVVVAIDGLALETERVELPGDLVLTHADAAGLPPEVGWPDPEARRAGVPPRAVCVIEDETDHGEPLPLEQASARVRALVRGMRIFCAGALAPDPVGWHRTDDGPWQPFPLGFGGGGHGDPWVLRDGDGEELATFLETVAQSRPAGHVDWALHRFELGLDRSRAADALTDHLHALRALLDGCDEDGRAAFSHRLAALCAEEGEREDARRRVERALALERLVMAGGEGYQHLDGLGTEAPAALIASLERDLRGLLRDVLCGYLDANLALTADEILLVGSEPVEIAAEDLREPPPEPAGAAVVTASAADPVTPATEPPEELDFEPIEVPGERESDTAEIHVERLASALDSGVTPATDWGYADGDYSAPI